MTKRPRLAAKIAAERKKTRLLPAAITRPQKDVVKPAADQARAKNLRRGYSSVIEQTPRQSFAGAYFCRIFRGAPSFFRVFCQRGWGFWLSYSSTEKIKIPTLSQKPRQGWGIQLCFHFQFGAMRRHRAHLSFCKILTFDPEGVIETGPVVLPRDGRSQFNQLGRREVLA